MDARNNIATDLFYKIRSRFSGLKLGAETGAITIIPEEARFFDFDYTADNNAIGHVSISLAEPNSMKVYFSHGITEGMDDRQKGNWYGFLKELRQFAKRRLLSFDTRDIAKDNLDQRDYEFLSQNAQPKQTNDNMIQKPVGESVMNESAMYGSRLMSYQNLLDTRLIIKHNQAVMDDTQPGARTRHISALFVENQDGERFKYPFIHLAGARAMQRHVANGGVPYDDVGKSIIRMSEEIAALKSFGNYVVRNDLMNSETNSVVERSSSYLNNLREQIKSLAKQSHYEAYIENFQAQSDNEVPQEVVEELTEKFTVRSFKEDIASVFPVLYRLMKEGNTIGYDDIVAMTQEELTNEDIEIDFEEENHDPFTKFEQWVMALGEDSAIVSEDPEEQQAAIKELQNLVGEHFPAGTDGTNAIESLKGIIEDPQLYKEIKEAAKMDPDTCVRGLVKNWLENNAPEVIEQLDFGDFVDPNEDPEAYNPEGGDDAEPASQEQPQMASMDQEQSEKINVQELAEFITSFYDRESNSFPKGPEGVCTMVGKKFGEQAEQVARKFVERMAPQQSTEQNPELAELARISELAGVSEGPMLDKFKAMGSKAADAVKGVATSAKTFFHKSAQDAVNEYMKAKHPGKEANTPQEKDAAIGMYMLDKGILDQEDLDKFKAMTAQSGGIFQACTELGCDFNMPEGGRNPGKLIKDLIYPHGVQKKDKDGNITSFRLAKHVEDTDMQEGPMLDKLKAFGKKAGDTVLRHVDITGYTKAKQNFERWIDKHPELASEKENLLSKFEAEADEDPHTPWVWGKKALEKWKEEKQQGSMAPTESFNELARIKELSGI